MYETADALNALARVGIYLTGVALATAGALGLAEAIDLGQLLAVVLFVVGLLLVVFVHERLDGPV